MRGEILGLAIGAILLIGMILIPALPPVKAQIFALTQSIETLPVGTYVVTPEGYWPITAWVAAHPGEPIPASLITITEETLGQPPVIIKEKTKTKVVHEEHEHHHHPGPFFKHKEPPIKEPPPPHKVPKPKPPPSSSGGGGSSGSSS